MDSGSKTKCRVSPSQGKKCSIFDATLSVHLLLVVSDSVSISPKDILVAIKNLSNEVAGDISPPPLWHQIASMCAV